MRGIGLTSDVNDSRRLALLIGEAVGKSDAFAKADEVMEAIGNFATSQARQSLSSVNLAGYAGLFAGMMESKTPGLDATGTANIIAQVSRSLSRGGAHGEASQFMSAAIGSRLGMNPFETQIWQEGGAFATLNDMFGKDSMAAKFGMDGPTGNNMVLLEHLKELRRNYGAHPAMLAQAAANHFDVSMNQAMALLSLDPKSMGSIKGRIEKLDGVNLDDVNMSSLATLGRIETGGRDTWEAVAADLESRTGKDALSEKQRKEMRDALDSGNAEKIKDVLSRLAATRDQSGTQGKDIRDSRVALENLKTSIADKLVPYTQDIRQGVLFMAGKGEMSSREVLEHAAKNDAEYAIRRINASADERLQALDGERRTAIGDLVPRNAYDLENQPFRKEYMAKMKAGTATETDRLNYQRKAREWEINQINRSSDWGREQLQNRQQEFDSRRQTILDERQEAIERAKAALETELKRIEANQDTIDRLKKEADAQAAGKGKAPSGTPTPGDLQKGSSLHGDTQAPAGKRAEVPDDLARVGSTPMPQDLAFAEQERQHRYLFETQDVNVNVRNERGEPIAPPQVLETNVRPIWPKRPVA